MAQFGSVRVLGTRGRRFESCHSDNINRLITPLVQLVERRFPKPNAVGSSPTGRAFIYKNYILIIRMIRIKRGSAAKIRRKKNFKINRGFQNLSQFRIINQTNLKAMVNSYRDRKKRKRFFRNLWIQRINSATRLHGFSFNQFNHFFKISKIQLNRKILSQLIIHEPEPLFNEISAIFNRNL